jgi:isopentenyl diphosphate isomerase/L-lactate dehydrogenase-like FMN-dependent dehydrogenase
MRSKFTEAGSNIKSGSQTDNSQGAARAISSFIDPGLSWKDIPWFQSITKMPIILKGVQRVEDVIRAIESGVQGVVLSNHGGANWILHALELKCLLKSCLFFVSEVGRTALRSLSTVVFEELQISSRRCALELRASVLEGRSCTP